jgi:MraZ protein
MSFTGEFCNSIDQKNRLSIPAKFRNSLDQENDKIFVLSKGFDECLFLYPLEEWKIVEEQLSSLSSIRDKNRNFIRKITRHANYVRYDSQGRIAIPEILLNYANISKEALIIGVVKKIEIWDKKTLLNYENQKNFLSDEDFEELANKINF